MNNATSMTDGKFTGPSTKDAILVLGAHRSGTSTVARVLNLMGVELGSDLLPPAADNEAGFWEHRQIQYIHDRIYEVLKLDWTNVSPLLPDWCERADVSAYREQLRDILIRDFNRSSLWGVKDPRMCAMMPLWRSLLTELNVQPRCIMICRNPLEVARSLGKRDKLSVSRVYLLWLRSIIDAERGSRGLPRTILTFESLLSDWPNQVVRMGRSLGLTWPRSTAEVAEDVTEFIRPQSRHHRIDDEEFLQNDAIPLPVRRLYIAVLNAAAGYDLNDLSATVDIIADELAHGYPLLTQFIGDLEQEHRNKVIENNLNSIQLNAQIAEVRTNLQSQVAATEEQLAILDQQRSSANQERAMAQVALETATKEIAELQASLTTASENLSNIGAQKSQLEQGITSLESTLAKRKDDLASLQNELGRVRNELGQYQIQRMILKHVSGKMRSSRAWRWMSRFLNRWVPLTEADLIAVSPMDNLGPNQWECHGPAQLAIPCLPVSGRIRIEIEMNVSVRGEAHFYFDTGELFNAHEHLDLGPVEGAVLIERELILPNEVHCFRLDPLDRNGEFTISHLRISKI